MNILGINFSAHDSAAGLIKDGKVIAAALEERFTRNKHDGRFPFNAINFCLKKAGMTVEELDYVAFYWNSGIDIETVETRDFVRDDKEHLYFVPNQLMNLRKVRKNDYIEQKIAFTGGKELKIRFIDHHMAHAASCFYLSGFDEAAILTVDSYGERTTLMMAHGKGAKIYEIKRVDMPHSLGQVYSTVTQYLGFRPNDGEGTVMGLAPYGKPKYYEQFKNIVKIKDDGTFEVDLSYFQYYLKRPVKYSQKFIDAFGEPRKNGEELSERHKDIAASLQKITEDVIKNAINFLYEKTKCNNLCMAGGVALNSVANGTSFRESKFKKVFIQPASDDSGTSIGAPLYLYHHMLGNPRNFVQINDYFGPEYDEECIKKILELSKAKYSYHKDIEKVCAKMLAEGKMIGWFQGRMEFGPRSLGNRSILANPKDPKMKDKLNSQVKHREWFRPFAPSVHEEKVAEYFEMDFEAPYMLLVCDVKENKKNEIPAITHVDGTARVQTVRMEQNPIYYGLIEEFGKITGTYVILNTSFNIKGEPIVCNPEDAMKCFFTTGLDALAIGNFLLVK